MTNEIYEPTAWLTLGVSEQVEMYLSTEEGRSAFAVWDTAFINTLPDAAFAVIQEGGEKDGDGKTVPRSLRKLPHHTAEVTDPGDHDSLDLAHLRNALARAPQTDLSPEELTRAQAHLRAHAEAKGIGEDEDEEEEAGEEEEHGTAD